MPASGHAALTGDESIANPEGCATVISAAAPAKARSQDGLPSPT